MLNAKLTMEEWSRENSMKDPTSNRLYCLEMFLSICNWGSKIYKELLQLLMWTRSICEDLVRIKCSSKKYLEKRLGILFQIQVVQFIVKTHSPKSSHLGQCKAWRNNIQRNHRDIVLYVLPVTSFFCCALTLLNMLS